MDPEARIRELEAELVEARATIDRISRFERENQSLKARVHELHSELITLSPPKLPAFSDAPRSSRPTKAGPAARARRSRLMSWTTLILVLAGAIIAALPYLFSYIDANNRGDQFTNERGLIAPPE